MAKKSFSAKTAEKPIKSHLRSFDVIGNIAVMKPRGATTLSNARASAKEIMRKNKHIIAVFKKVGRTEGEERIPKIVWIAGKRTSATMHKENGCVFYVDVKKVFFTPRLSSERLRIVKMVEPHESVLDMFCGIGSYSIQAAKTAKEVYAVDINHDAIEELNKNIRLNKLDNIHAFEGDSKRIVGRIKKKFDRIIMNFPVRSYDFLQTALKAAKKECVIHMYAFIDESDGYENAVSASIEKIKQIVSADADIKKIDAKKAGEVAPYTLRVCFDIYIERR